MAIATSIDALAVGITFAFFAINIFIAIAIIGITTFCISAAGVKIGHLFGTRFKSRAELIGGIFLVLLGVKILVEHLFFNS
jgi:putative Mn2+ efflux pump MntP